MGKENVLDILDQLIEQVQSMKASELESMLKSRGVVWTEFDKRDYTIPGGVICMPEDLIWDNMSYPVQQREHIKFDDTNYLVNTSIHTSGRSWQESFETSIPDSSALAA